MSKYFKCTTNKPAISYKCGEKIIFTVTSKANCQNVLYNFFEWTLKGDDGKEESGIFKFDNFRPAVFETTLDRPGFVQLTVTAKTNDGDDKSFDLLRAAAGAEIEKLEYCDTIPEDFDEYWAGIENLVADHTPEILFKEELTVGVPEGYRAYDVRLSVPCDGRPASGIFTIPKKEGKYPIKMIFQGYGASSPASATCIENTICFVVNAHGIENQQTPELKEHYNKILANYGMSDSENASNMTAYWRNMMIRDLTAVKFAKTFPEWDKKGIVTFGGSQGALQSITVAAHDSDITFVDVYIPWFCNLNAESYGFIKSWRPHFAEGLRYFDTVAQATRVKCPVKISARLGDVICEPSTTATLYNYFKTPKTIEFVQAGTHNYYPPEPELFNLTDDPNSPEGLVKGKYRHYKGGEYEVIDFGVDSETLEDVVIYKSLETGKIWVRPVWMFEETICINALPVKRFEYIG